MGYRFSANTGFLWPDMPFLDKIRHAARVGFDAVEFHDEAQRAEPDALAEVLAETDLPVIGLNIRMGADAGAAVPAFVDATRRDIDAAVGCADLVDAGAIHVVGGLTDAPDAGQVFRQALAYALSATTRRVVIEPMCAAAMPGAHLRTLAQACDILDDLNHPRLGVLFDCFHIAMEEGVDHVLPLFKAEVGRIAHVQIAAVPARDEPLSGDLDLKATLAGFHNAGYDGAFGCEYRQKGEDSAVMAGLRAL